MKNIDHPNIGNCVFIQTKITMFICWLFAASHQKNTDGPKMQSWQTVLEQSGNAVCGSIIEGAMVHNHSVDLCFRLC